MASRNPLFAPPPDTAQHSAPLVLSNALQSGLRDGAKALQKVIPAFLGESVILAAVALVFQLLPLNFQAHGHLATRKGGRHGIGSKTAVLRAFVEKLH